jgi:hypothetical protein
MSLPRFPEGGPGDCTGEKTWVVMDWSLPVLPGSELFRRSQSGGTRSLLSRVKVPLPISGHGHLYQRYPALHR